MNVPAELKYTKEHEWIRVEGEEAVVGITDYAQSQLGDIVFVECETVGDALEAGETFGTMGTYPQLITKGLVFILVLTLTFTLRTKMNRK